ncbi:MAG: hypothetical protein M3380_08405, partial [Chloroflexota bacterium]|nr:hypothetical protein [Chloroflexota bacterium]
AGLALYLLSWCTMYYGLAGRPFSLSAIYPAWNNRLFDVGLWGALALGAVAVGMGMARARAGASAAALAAGWAAAFVLGSLAGLVLLVLLLARVPPNELPNLAAWTTLLLAAAQLAGAGLATPPAMLLAATVAEVIGRGR